MKLFATIAVQLSLFASASLAAEPAKPMTVEKGWLQPPKTYDAPGFQAEGVRPLFFDSVPWHGKPTRAFAWIGLP